MALSQSQPIPPAGSRGLVDTLGGARKALSEHCISSRSRRVAFWGKESIVSGNLSSSVFDSSVMCPSLYHGCSRRVLLSTLHGSIRSEPGSICSEVILTSAAFPPGVSSRAGTGLVSGALFSEGFGHSRGVPSTTPALRSEGLWGREFAGP